MALHNTNGAGAPGDTPTKLGQHYTDTSSGDIYISKGIASAADWVLLQDSAALGTMATQDANAVAITGGSIAGITDLAIADGGTGQSTATAAFDALAPTTTAGDLIYHNGTDNVRLGIGTAGQILKVNAGATAPEWGAPSAGTIGGATGSTDNAIIRADGTGGTTVQSSGITIDDSNNVSGVVALAATSIELGHASDTTLTRVSAGVVAIEGQNILTAATGQPLDSDLTTIAGLTATTDNFLQAKSSAWASRTVAQVSADLQATGLVTDAVGFRTIPQNSQSAAYTTVAADSGKHILHPAADTNARTFTIDSNANVAYPVGTAITFVNETSQVVSIAITSDTLTLAGTTTTGTRSLAQNGMATALKVTSTKWIISGSGLT